ncbi:MAG TPA: hypothetical protein VFA18_22655 [Gemmataceae bacterium]|nr:hypothetical protein [Gemmataceae bacterium]
MRLFMSWLPPLAFAFLSFITEGAQAQPPTHGGRRAPAGASGSLACTAKGTALAQVLDSLQVQTHWLAGQSINDWQTGLSDNRTGGPRTHCSLFVSAVCQKLHIPMLDPPPQTFLSNRQQNWLVREGRGKGWRQVKDPVEAQWLANQGVVVLASYKSRDAKKAGHIAVVRPAVAAPAEVRARGPWITQAGARNYRKTDTRTGFKNHPAAWKNREIHYFAYRPTDLANGTPVRKHQGGG